MSYGRAAKSLNIDWDYIFLCKTCETLPTDHTDDGACLFQPEGSYYASAHSRVCWRFVRQVYACNSEKEVRYVMWLWSIAELFYEPVRVHSADFL